MGIVVRRISDVPRAEDGVRVLVDRYWPRGSRYTAASQINWMRALAPSPESVAWFGHKPERWEEFKQRYWAELEQADKRNSLTQLREQATAGTVTLVYGGRHPERNTARALAEYLNAVGVPTDAAPPRREMVPTPSEPARRTFRWPARSTMQWGVLGLSVFLPLSGLLIIQIVLAYGAPAGLVCFLGFAAFAAATVIRVYRQELFVARLNDAIPRDPAERESRWVIARGLFGSVAQTLVAYVAIALLLFALASIATRGV